MPPFETSPLGKLPTLTRNAMCLRALLLLPLLNAMLAAATLSIEGRTFRLDAQPFDMWGIRVASASQTQELTDALIANLDAYKAHGVNTVSIYYMGSSGAYSDPFTPDGSGIAREHQRRMEQIIAACDQRGMVAIVGIFYQRADQPKLRDWDAAVNAVRIVTRTLQRHRNVIINIANEQNSSRYGQMRWGRVREPAAVIELCQLVKQTDPQRLVGAGGYDHEKNIVIGKSRAVDTLLFDTNGPESSGDLYLRFLASGVDKPMVNVETFGAWTNQFNPQGVFPDHVMQTYAREIEHAVRHDGLYLHFHNSPWLQQSIPGTKMRYDLGGRGTAQEPGIRWYFELVRKHAPAAVPGSRP